MRIRTLEELEREIIDVQANTDLASGIGMGVGILGGLTALIGFGLSLNESTKDTGNNMMKGGAAVGAIGGATSIAAGGTNCFLAHRKIKNAQEVLEDDHRSTDKFLPFLRKAEQLNQLFLDIFSCSIASTTLNDILKVFEEVWIIAKEVGKDTLEVFGEIFSCSGGVNVLQVMASVTPKIKQILQKFRHNEQSIKSVMKIVEIVKRTPLALEIPKLFLSLKDCIPHIKNVQLFSSLLTLAKNSVYTITFDGTFVYLTLIKLGIDVVALLSLKDDFGEKGNEYSKMVNEATRLLKVELKFVTEKYESMRRNG